MFSIQVAGFFFCCFFLGVTLYQHTEPKNTELDKNTKNQISKFFIQNLAQKQRQQQQQQKR